MEDYEPDQGMAEGMTVVHFQPVTVVRDSGPNVEIGSGLSDGTSIVLNPGADLADGAKVRVQSPKVPKA